MAPEVVNRKGHGTAADWWSYGVLMVILFTFCDPSLEVREIEEKEDFFKCNSLFRIKIIRK